jgi:hypothetical protein
MKRTFVHKSIEKTQKFKYFWVFLSGFLCLQPKCSGMAVNRFDQGRNMLRRGKLANAVAQIKDVCGSSAVGIGMRFTKTVQNPNDLFLNVLRRCEQAIGIDIALQRLARAIDSTAHHLAGTA